MQSQHDYDMAVFKQGQSWVRTCQEMVSMREAGTVIHRLALKGPWSHHEEMLVIVTAEIDGVAKVCFHGVDDIQSLWTGFANRLAGGRMKWRDDEYAR